MPTNTFDLYNIVAADAANDTLTGSGNRIDVFFGRRGDDTLNGAAGDDDLLGGAGVDQLYGGAGADHLDGGDGGDRLYGGDGADGLRGDAGNDFLDEGAGHGDLEGGMGNDTLAGGPGADAFVIDPDSGHDRILDFRAGPGMFDHLALNDIEPDDLSFEDGEEGVTISWNGGTSSVLLVGVDKADLAQDDFMFADQKQVIPIGGVGNGDNAMPSSNQTPPPAASDSDEIVMAGGDWKFDDFQVRTGGANTDNMYPTAERDFFFGREGGDWLESGGGEDDLLGGPGNDELRAGSGMNHLMGEDGNDTLVAGDAADNLMGGPGSDSLSAGGGHDMLEGGPGDDLLDGGDGADAFMVSPDSGNDLVIGGFTPGAGAFDHIAFMDILPSQVRAQDVDGGVRFSWDTGSITIEGVQKNQMTQDDFMFSSVEGGSFLEDSAISSSGSALLFPPGS